MNIIFVSDIDGTLLKTNTDLPANVIESSKAFVLSGGGFAICTGRSVEAARYIAEQLPINLPCILLGGSIIYDYTTNTFIQKRSMDSSIRHSLNAIMTAYPTVSVNVYTESHIYIIKTNSILLEKGVYEDRSAPIIPLDEVSGELYKILLTSEDPEILKHIAASDIDSRLFDITFASTHFYEITARGANKGSALSFLKEHSENHNAVCHVAGDGGTDLAMRPYADIFYAPETASEIVRSKADFIFPSPALGGISVAFQNSTLLLNSKRQ
ncbi:MAG: HAD family hydrolase [Oscillospiraceae bacterium]